MDAQREFFTLAERDGLLHELSVASSQYDLVITLELNESGACRGALNGARTVKAMYQAMLDENMRFRKEHPGSQN